MRNTRDKIDILQDIDELVSIKRIDKSTSNLSSFIKLYFKHLTPNITPPFHREILQLLQDSIIPANSVGLNDTHNNKQVHTKVHDLKLKGAIVHGGSESHIINKDTGINNKEEGRDDPLVPPDSNIIPSPQFTPTKTESLDKEDKSLSNLDSEKLNRLLFIAPRGFSKSTLCSRFFPMWLAIFAKRKDIFIVSATMALAIENLRIIREELEANERLKKDFGELKSDKWREDMIILNNGTIIRAKGQGFQIRGFRPDMIVCDDLEDENIIYSKDQREKLEHWFFRTLLPSLKPDQNLVYVGTKLHTQSLMSNLQKKDEFLSRFYAAITNEESIWEDRWPLVSLRKLQRELGTYAFQAEYQNNPISLADQPIKPHYLTGVKIEPGIRVSCLAIDPAISEKESSDYRAFCLFGRTADGFKEILTERNRWGINEQIDRIIDIYVRYKPDRILVEEVAFQKIYRQLLTEKARERGIFLPISTAELGVGPDKRPKDKMTRLLSVSHLFEQKLVQVDNPDLIEELLAFPTGDHDDLVDATVFSLYWLMNSKHGGVFQKKEKVALPGAVESFYVSEPRPGVYVTKVGEPPKPTIHSNFISYG